MDRSFAASGGFHAFDQLLLLFGFGCASDFAKVVGEPASDFELGGVIFEREGGCCEGIISAVEVPEAIGENSAAAGVSRIEFEELFGEQASVFPLGCAVGEIEEAGESGFSGEWIIEGELVVVLCIGDAVVLGFECGERGE